MSEETTPPLETVSMVRLSNAVDIRKLTTDPILWDAVKYAAHFANEYGLKGKRLEDMRALTKTSDPLDPDFGMSAFFGFFSSPKTDET